MNKILKISIVVVLCLIVVLMITLFACNQTGGNGDDKTTTTTTTTTKKPEPCVEHVDTDTDGKCDVCGEDMPKAPCTEHVDTDADGKCDVCGEDMPKTPVSSDFTEVNDTVYVIALELNIRTSPNADASDNIKSSAKYGEALKRTGFSEDGWTRIDVDGVALYVRSTYVVTDKPILDSDFKDVDDVVYVTNEEGLTMRSTPFRDQSGMNSLTSFPYGKVLKRTGIATREDSEGITWSRLEIDIEVEGEDGKTVSKVVTAYASSKYLDTKKPNEVDPDNGIKFEKSYDILTVKVDSVNLRNAAIFDDSTEARTAKKDEELQAIAKGTEADGTIWYKVVYEGEVYYVIYNSVSTKKVYFDIAKYDGRTAQHKLFDEKISITLPAYYVEAVQDEDGYYFDSTDVLVFVQHVKNTNKDIKSAKDLANATAAAMDSKLGVRTDTENGVDYLYYSVSSTDINDKPIFVLTIVTFTKGSGEDYAITTFQCDEKNYKNLTEEIFTCATSITVK